MERTWLITGCSSGLGKGIAKAVLARETGPPSPPGTRPPWQPLP